MSVLNDWSSHTVKFPQLVRSINDFANDRDYIAAMDVVVELRAELQLLKLCLIEKVIGEQE